MALSFGFSYSIVVFFLYCTAVLLTPLWRLVKKVLGWAKKICPSISKISQGIEDLEIPRLNAEKAGIALVGVFGVVLIIISLLKNIEIFKGLVTSVGLISFCYILWCSTKTSDGDADEKRLQRNVKLGLIFAIYLIPLVVGRFQGSVLDQTMSLIGIRNGNVVVHFRSDYKNFVVSEVGDGINGNYKAVVLFHGFGANNVLEINENRFVVPNSQYFLKYE